MRLLFLAFLLIPIVEMYILIKVGGVIGALPTIALVVATAAAGAGLLRWQGLSTLYRVRQTMARGELPALELVEGAIMLVGGALLLTPGFVTDAIGLVCLIPALRCRIALGILRRAVVISPVPPRAGPRAWEDRATIEGDYRREE